MKPTYKKLLKELEKGNAVLLDVVGLFDIAKDRYRLVSPEKCEYDNVYILNLPDTCFSKSCFIKVLPEHLLNPESIVTRMEQFDGDNGLEIRKMQVLK